MERNNNNRGRSMFRSYMLIEVPPKYSILDFMEFLKGKSSIVIYSKWANMRFNIEIENFGVEDIM